MRRLGVKKYRAVNVVLHELSCDLDRQWTCISLSTYGRSKNAVLVVIDVTQAHIDRFLKE